MGIGVVRLKLGGGSVHHIIRLMECHALSLACYMIEMFLSLDIILLQVSEAGT